MNTPTRRKIRVGIGVAALVLAAAALGAGTYAAFVDSESGPGGTIAAGTLDLTVGSTGTTQLFSAANIVPGYTQDVAITLKNAGSVPGTLTSTLAVTGADVTCTEPEAEAEGKAAGACNTAGDLQNQMTVSVIKGPGITTATAPVTVAQFATSGLPAAGTLAAGASTEYDLRFTLPNLSGTENNKVQGDSLNLTSSFLITQS